MLQTIRDHTQGWIAGTIITVVILSFALWGIHSYFVGGSNDRIVASVNGIDIPRERLTVAYERLRRQVQMQYGANQSITTKDEAALKNQALQALIDIEVLKQASVHQSFLISNQQVDAYLQNIPEFQINGHFSVGRFQELLASTMLSTNEFLDLIKTTLLIDQPKLGIIFTSFALPQEIKDTIALVNQSRDIKYVNIPQQIFLSQVMMIPEERIKQYYTAHKIDFMTPEQVNIEYIMLSQKDLASKVNPSDSVLKNSYNENINSYTQPMKWKLADIQILVSEDSSQEDIVKAQNKANAVLVALKNGESFSKLASIYSHHLNAQQWIILNDVPLELQKAVSQLNKKDELSNLIKTNKGFVILKVVDVQAPQVQTFDQVKNKVKEAYARQYAEEKFAELREQMANLTYEHPDSLQFAAKTLSLPIQTSDLFSRDKGGKDITQNKKVRTAAFSNDVLSLQNNSDVIQLNADAVIVLRIKSHMPSTLLPLKDIHKQIEDKLKTDEADQRAAQFANNLKTKLIAGEDPTHFIAVNHLTWTNVGTISRYSTKVDPAILDTAFRLPHPEMVKAKMTYGIAKLPSGYALVALQSVKEGTVTDQKQYDIYAEQVQNSDGGLEYQLYKQSQTKKSKIKVYQN